MNAIFVGSFLLACAVGYVVLIIAAIRAVGRSRARRRNADEDAPQGPRSRALDATSVTLLACSVAVTGAIVLMLGYSPHPIDDVSEAKFVGTWVSATSDAPGELQLAEARKATTRNLTVLDPSAY